MTTNSPKTHDVWLIESTSNGRSRWLRVGTATIDENGTARLSIAGPNPLPDTVVARPNKDGSATAHLPGNTVLNFRAPRDGT